MLLIKRPVSPSDIFHIPNSCLNNQNKTATDHKQNLITHYLDKDTWTTWSHKQSRESSSGAKSSMFWSAAQRRWRSGGKLRRRSRTEEGERERGKKVTGVWPWKVQGQACLHHRPLWIRVTSSERVDLDRAGYPSVLSRCTVQTTYIRCSPRVTTITLDSSWFKVHLYSLPRVMFFTITFL